MHVLIIEDEALLAMDLQCFLEELGADSCALADSEADAVRSAMEQPPDLITADMELREGTGLGAVRAIRKRIGEVPVVYVTGQPDRCEGLDDHTHAVRKPILWLELVEALQPHNLPPPELGGPAPP